ncbi:T9SS type B sorting domain-containing protein [Maribacter forsetii]|uniref:T9SS type B sorting domain-containing protein n=1 Tax=Maribacter forsetii TaxID=444515 RepID=UPI0012FA348F|nr:gliding motility-associated C-terminal domain-containing protein [Maribacter forsetii]
MKKNINNLEDKSFKRFNTSVKLFFTVLIILMIGEDLVAQSQPVFPNTQVLVQGTANQPGAVYRIDDVALNVNGSTQDVDALLTLVSFTGTPVVGDVDNTQFVQNRFEPTITYDTAGEAVRWRMQFIVAGSSDANIADAVPVPLDTYTLEIIDLDAQEWAEVIVPQSYELAGTAQPETIITTSAGTIPNSIRFTSANITDPGVSTANTRSIVKVNYVNVSVVDFTLGRDNADPSTTRNISVGFLGEVTFSNPNTVVVNTPPSVVNSSTSTTINTASNSVNLLTGASDNEGNIDPSTIYLLDPNDELNTGNPGNSLTIPNEGTYVVDNSGNIVFTPVFGFVGDSTINFRVEDVPGASSNEGVFTVTVTGACSITAIDSTNESSCNDNGTAIDINDDTFTADITVTFINTPVTGTLDLTGDGSDSVSVVGLTSPHTFIGVELPANGSEISLTATFSSQSACSFTDNSVVNSPFECSDENCSDVIPPGSPSNFLNSGEVSFDITNPGTNTSAKTFNSITVEGETFSELLVPDNISYSYNTASAGNQQIIENGIDGSNITDDPSIFDPALIDANTDRNLNHYFRNDGSIFASDYVNFKFNYDINAASNRYVVITERNGNNTMEVQAIDANGDVIGTARPVLRKTDPGTTYIDTGVPNDNGQNIFATVYPLTAFVGSNVPINGVRITQSGANGGDGGDGKVFIVYNPFFLTPPPTISLTTTVTQPTCPSNQGAIDIVATSNGGGALEYSINGSSGPWQNSSSFSPGPGSYTAAVRYVGAPLCMNVDSNSVSLTDASCNPGPVAGDENETTPEDVNVVIDLTNDDTDDDGVDDATIDLDPVTAGQQTTLTVSGEGTFTNNGDGTITFDPLPTFIGTSSISYIVNDNLGNTSNTANIDVSVLPDNDKDGIPNTVDLDDDNDGILDTEETGDTDGDGIPDSIDLDSDNDGIPDIIEAGGIDTDGDGHIDYPTPGDPTSMIDDNDDGLADEIATTPLPDEDSDNDGIKDRLDLDADNDGIPDVIEAGGTDSNNDGIIDDFATDTDNDGLADSVDPVGPATSGTPLENPDTDNDGLDDRIDLDSENDGIPDVIEAGGTDPDNDGRIGTGTITDADNDGLSDLVDTDDNTTGTLDDGLGTALPIDNFDGDSVPNHLDIDSDNDGITDTTEAGGLDVNGDGVVDGFDDTITTDGWDDATATSPLPIPNTDGAGGANYLDIDADDDGIPDNVEAQTTSGYIAPDETEATNGLDSNYPVGLTPEDTDNDLTPDYLDADSDNDGINDVFEAGQGTIVDPLADADNDGLNDAFDDTPGNDVNNDLDTGAIATDNEDDADLTEVDFRSVLDFDGDGIPDTVDLDDDNDGISDLDESNGIDPSADDDNDGVPNHSDDDPNDLAIGDVNGTTEPEFDFDGDGIPNHFDLDGDNDGIFDVYEAGNDALDTNNDGVIDSLDDDFVDSTDNGQADNSEGTTPINTDSTGGADYLDIDADDDGIPDNVEAQPTAIYVAPAATFSPNGVDTNYPNGLRPEDTDTDLTPDYLDVDSDNDGTPDVIEAGQGEITDPLADADSDGLNDAFDDTSGNDVNNDLDIGAIATDNEDDLDTAEVDFRSILDRDQDGIMDIVDLDDDNDGISDLDESNGIDPSADDDNDGVANYLDDDPNDPAIGDVNGTTEPAFDFDGDGIPNHFDIDADNDGIVDVVESGNGDLDTNNDGVIDGLDTGFADTDDNGQADDSEGTTPPNTDGTGEANFLDIDADDDGIPDNVEAQPTDAYIVPADAFDTAGLDTNYPSGIEPEDTDLDGIPDYIDTDSDADGIDDVLEAGQGTIVDPLADADNDGLNDAFDDTPGNDVNNDLDTGAITTDNEDDSDVTEVDFRSVLDFDQDGIPDTVDLDDDNDGISDLDEANGIDPSADADNDGVPNHSDDDPNDPAIGDVNGTTEPAFDFDGDGIPNHFDIDSDNDGIVDVVEAGNGDIDTNNDGVIDANDSGFADANTNGQSDSSEGTTPPNTDGTGEANFLDIDSDDDGIPDNVEAQPTDAYIVPADAFDTAGLDTNYPGGLVPEDTDFDGIPDYIDSDSDSDGVEDALEAGQGTMIDPLADADGDGLNDAYDDTLGLDVNNDLNTGAIATDNEDDANLTQVDFRDILDFDEDGIPDSVDLDDDNDGISDLDEANGIDPSADADNDGVPNHSDDDPNDPAIGDVNGTTEPVFDFDGDGIPNHFDIDADNDGITDVVESGNGTLDTNNDGVVNAEDSGFVDANTNGQSDSSEGTTPPNTDGTGEANFLDIDADDDGIPDNVEAQPTSGYVAPAASFDAAGLDTNYPDGLIPEDTDGDGTPDYLDLDSEDDGVLDIDEAGQGTFTDVDSDADGLDDGFDDTPGPDVNNDLDTGADGTDNDDDDSTPEVDFREIGDSDGDGVLDTQEEVDGTDKNDPCDYVIENVTLAFSGDYLVADCDGDGVINGQELDDDTNPEDPCDYDEGSITLEQGGDYLISDCDEDGLTTSQELAIGTDPDVADTDGDTIVDGQEIIDGTDPLNPCDSLNGVPTLAAGCGEELVESGISVINEIITPDNDGTNDEFLIENIESYPNNTVQIYNRWGVIVYEMNGYDNVTNTFKGVSNGRVTISTDAKLPVGTYFYIIKYNNNGNNLDKAGYLYINR